MTCNLPQAGWKCTRVAGHEGPCAAVPADSADDYVAHLRYVRRYGGTRIVVCDSDEDGAFKVYRRPHGKTAPAEEREELARRFHETYERLAPEFGYETRKESARPWDQVPPQNKQLMIAVAAELIAAGWRKGGRK